MDRLAGRVYSLSMVFMTHRPSSVLLVVARSLAILLAAGAVAATGQVPKAARKPTELVVLRYEKLVADGALLTPEGWKRASKLFDQPVPYPADGTISVESTGGLLAEDWLRGDHAQVETKWNDAYGSIDANLKFSPAAPGSGAVLPMVQVFTLHRTNDQGEETADWKVEGPHQRHATITWAIKYLETKRDKSRDPVIRKNANKTIDTLRRLNMSRGCGSASAC